MDPTLQQALQNLPARATRSASPRGCGPRWTKKLDYPDQGRPQGAGEVPVVRRRLRLLRRPAGRELAAARPLLTDAGVDFGILYEGERNSGNDVRRVGEEGLFELLAEHNIAALDAAQTSRRSSPPTRTRSTRCATSTRSWARRYTVWHYTELLAHLIETGAIPVQPLGLRVTYHDPCYLARYNGVTEAPRRILSALGCELVEMPRNRVQHVLLRRRRRADLDGRLAS